MIAMASRYIRDDSMDKQFVDAWNAASKATRSKLLTEAGRNPHHKYKTWAFLPHDIRVDVSAILKREKPAPQPQASNQDQY